MPTNPYFFSLLLGKMKTRGKDAILMAKLIEDEQNQNGRAWNERTQTNFLKK